eukprot:310120_1
MHVGLTQQICACSVALRRNTCYAMKQIVFLISIAIVLCLFSAININNMHAQHDEYSIGDITFVIENDLNCTWNKDDIQFIDCRSSMKLRHQLPPYLISFEGSGNTYTRLIIELVCQHFTGNVHGLDEPLRMAGFKGENHCDDSVIVLKAHAHYYLGKEWDYFVNGTSTRVGGYSFCRNLRSSNINNTHRCNDNAVGMMNAIFLSEIRGVQCIRNINEIPRNAFMRMIKGIISQMVTSNIY